jgi:hypothetical protein
MIAGRLRQAANEARPRHDVRLAWLSLEQLMAGDAGHLHRAHNLAALPIESHRRLSGPITVAMKRTLRRLLHPLVEEQSTWNGASARVTTLLLHELIAQSRSIESLEAEMKQLREDLGR